MSLLALLTGLTAAAAFFVAVNGYVPPPLCPQLTPMTNFIPVKANGQWFVQFGNSIGTNSADIKCEMRTLTATHNGAYITVHVDFLQNDDDAEAFDTNFLLDLQGSYLIVQYSPTNNTQIAIDTDYETYAIWVDCFQLGEVAGYTIVAMTRERQIDEALKNQILAIMDENEIGENLSEMVQTNCRQTV